MKTDAEKAQDAKAHHYETIRANYLRAVQNIAWLSQPSPQYADGAKLGKHEAYNLLKLNQAAKDWYENHNPEAIQGIQPRISQTA